MATVILEAYGKAVIVKGDTKSIKDSLKALGGKWNGKLVGWIYPGSKRDTLLTALRGNPQVGKVVDKAGGGEPAALAPSDNTNTAPKADTSASASTTQAAADGEDGVWNIGDLTRVSVNVFCGKTGVDVRKFYKERGSDELKPTAKGIRMGVEAWEHLCKNFGAVDGANGAEETKVTIQEDLVVTVRKDNVDIRQFYKDKSDGEMKPGKKGCCLARGEWSKLKALAGKISEELTGARSSSAGEPAKKKQRTSTSAAPTASAASPEKANDAAGSEISYKKLRKTLEGLLEGRDLSALTPKLVRSELEAKLSLADGALNDRREVIKEMLTTIIQS